MPRLRDRLSAAVAAFRAAQQLPAYAVIYDTPLDLGPSDEAVEQYYERFTTPQEAWEFFRDAYPAPETENARLVMILGGIDAYRRA